MEPGLRKVRECSQRPRLGRGCATVWAVGPDGPIKFDDEVSFGKHPNAVKVEAR